MREFFHSIKFKIFVGIAAVLIGLMVRTAMSGGLSTITASITGIVLTPAQKVSAQISDFFYGAFSSLTSISTEKADNAKLKKKVSDLESRLVDYNEVKRQNDQYKQMYGISQNHPDFKQQPAMVVSRDPGQWFSSFTIDKGRLNRIALQEPVVTPDGLVGVVTQTMATSSVVTTVLDPSFSVQVMVSETGDLGMAQGDLELSSKGKFKVNYLSKQSAVAPGDIIVTSGKSDIYPGSLKVGIVEDVQTENTGMALVATCKPFVDPSTAKDVTVITDFSGKVSSASSSSASSSSKAGGK